MKNFKTILLALILILSSCSNNEEKPSEAFVKVRIFIFAVMNPMVIQLLLSIGKMAKLYHSLMVRNQPKLMLLQW